MCKNDFVTVHEAAKVLEVSIDTIRRWSKKGLIKAKRNELNYRTFSIDELERVKHKYIDGKSSGKFRTFRARKKTPYTVLELFSGCGGLALGLDKAGLRTVGLLEIDKDCVETLKQNRKDWNVFHEDVRASQFDSYEGSVDVLAGGFPCQAFSYAGLSKGFEDTRGTLFFEFARAARVIKPKIIIAENVRGLVKHDNGRTLSTILATLNELGYRTATHLLRAQFLDVPQKRERLLIIGIRNDLQSPFLVPRERDYIVSLRDAISDCKDYEGVRYPTKKFNVMKLVPEGGYWRDLPLDIQKKFMGKSFYLGGGKTGMARRLAWDEPSLTLTCNPAQKQTERCHPSETRPLSVREYARIQTFPDSWKFAGSIASRYKQIGNAVPVNMGYHVGRSIIAMLENKSNSSNIVRICEEILQNE